MQAYSEKVRCEVLFVLAAIMSFTTGSIHAATIADIAAVDQPGWIAFLGRMHVVFLHLPIGILIAAFAIELFGMFRRSRGYDVAAGWLLVLGAVTAWVACTTGWFLEETDSNVAINATFNWHKWLGISLAIVATLAAVLKVLAVKKQWKPAADESGYGQHPGGAALLLARLGLVAIMILLPVTGHLGGNMVHGQKYLTEFSPIEFPDFVVRFPNSLYEDEQPGEGGDGKGGGDPAIMNASLQSWNTTIQPIMNAKCVECHGDAKQKGEYRLDTLAFAIMEGDVPFAPGLSDPPKANIVPGSRVLSELYYRVAIPGSHNDYMPTKGDGLTPDEVELLGKWIDSFTGDLEGKPAPGEGEGTSPVAGSGEPEPETPARPTYDPMVERKIEESGANVQPVSQEQNANLMRVTYAFRSEAFTPGSLKVLAEAADSVAQLELQGTTVGDADLADLPRAMPKITRLNLKDTPITDAGLANLPDMPALEWINLFGTEITDAGLEQLAKYTSLKTVYVTGTPVTAEAVAKLKESLPEGAQVFSDYQFNAAFDLSGGTPDPQQQAESDTPAPAQPVNTKCPVSGADVDVAFTSVYEDKTVAFCCDNCKKKFDTSPAEFAANIK